ncbi:MAG TPA: hypothetical protein VF002_03165 [Gaiellaceae bacterium]
MPVALNLILALLVVAGLAAVCGFGHLLAAERRVEEASVEELVPPVRLERAA